MKYSTFLILFSTAVTCLWSCKSFEGAAVTAKPDPIEVHADSIEYKIRITVPPKANMKKGGVYYGEAKIGKRSQRRASISADTYPDLKNTGMDTLLKVYKPFHDDMDDNPLFIEQKYERKGKTFELPNIDNIARCCITTSRLVEQNDQFLFSEHEYVPPEPVHIEARFNFPADVFEIQEEDYSKGDIVSIGEFIAQKRTATSVTIKGFASPEGPYERNVNLSINRSKEVQKWLTEQLKATGFEAYLDSSFFKISYTHEDWEGFKASVSQLPYSDDVKSQIIEIISAGLTEDEKESQIMALVGGKDKVENILAPLRRATIVMDGMEPRKTDEEIDLLANTFAEGKFEGDISKEFEKEEWLYAISRMEDPAKKMPLLEAFHVAYPVDVRALNDMGVFQIMGVNGQVDVRKGFDLLEKAQKLNDGDPAVNNNMGVAYKLQDKLIDAEDLYRKSLAARNSPEASFNLGVVLEKMAEYNEAIDRFETAKDIKFAEYNLGLCKLLSGNLGGAKSSLGSHTANYQDHALGYYLLAVTSARASDRDGVVLNLRKAVELDSDLKAKAKKDLEFRKVVNSAEFKAATN